MSTPRHDNSRRGRAGRGRVPSLEALEGRALLAAAETFSAPSLTDLIQAARQGRYTAPAAIDRMVQALQAQLTSGPLADLKSGAAVDGNGFVAEAQSLVASYDQNADQQLSPAFPNVDELIKLQGQRVVADLVALNQQHTVGILSGSLATGAQAAINSLTAGPIKALGTPVSAYVSTTRTFESDLNTLAQDLGSATLTTAQVSTTVLAEAEAYRADLYAGLLVTHPNISNTVGTAVNTLEGAAGSLDQSSSSNAQAQLTNAINAFDTAILDTTGLFGTQGVISQALSSHRVLSPNLRASWPATALSVSGSATSGGTATLTATLTAAATSQGVSGATVGFTLNGAFAGTAVTNGSGVATLSGVPTTAPVGTQTGAIVASFAGDLNDKPSSASGDLIVS